MQKKNVLILLAVVVGVLVVALGVYYFFFAGCSDCPTLKYFRLET